MRIITQLSISALLLLPAAAGAVQPVDFDKIEHWTGSGPNRAALVIQFQSSKDPHAYIWGYRWNDGETPTGEDMFKAVCANSSELVMLTQYTGQYGATLCGVGFGDAAAMLDYIYFDFDMAKDYEWINFDYYSTNSWFGQSEAPGDNTPRITQQAIDDARATHVIQHPIDYHAYGYPAYDYDCWKINDKVADLYCWQSGWYAGYWSYWVSSDDDDEWMYSGTGFSGRRLSDGAVDAWSYTVFDKPGVGGFGEGTPPADDLSLVSYRPARTMTSLDARTAVPASSSLWYTLSGIQVAVSAPGETPATLTPGIYLVKTGCDVSKILVR